MTLLETWANLKKQADSSDADALERLARAYASGYTRIDPQVQVLAEQLDLLQKAGKLTPEQVRASAAYKQLMSAVVKELDDFAAYLRMELSTAAADAAARGLLAGDALLKAAAAQSIGVEIEDLPKGVVIRATPETLKFLDDYLDPKGPLFARINNLSGYHAEQIAAGIVERVGLGQNPRKIAAWITDGYGVPLTDSLRTMRTVQLYSYRGANLATMKANDDIVTGWSWCAELDDVCCIVCVTMHGTEHTLDETMDSHYNCRCAPIPLVKGTANSIEQNGVDWLEEQSESAQRQVLGAKYDGWKNGDFKLTDIIGNHESDVYGNMLVEKPLKDLLGE